MSRGCFWSSIPSGFPASMRLRFLVGLTVLSVASGCAGISPVQVGQTAGTIAGAAIAPGVGAPLGAAVGMIAGMILQRDIDKINEKKERRELGDQLSKNPAASAASAKQMPAGEPARVWVDETLQDGRLVAGHFEIRPL